MQTLPGLLATTENHLEQWQLTVDDSNHARLIQIVNSSIKTSLTIDFVNRFASNIAHGRFLEPSFTKAWDCALFVCYNSTAVG